MDWPRPVLRLPAAVPDRRRAADRRHPGGGDADPAPPPGCPPPGRLAAGRRAQGGPPAGGEDAFRAHRQGAGAVITLAHFLTLSAILFSIGIAGIVINRKNIIVLLMCIELMLLAVSINLVAFSRFLLDVHGQVFVFFILTVAAAEAAIGLAILVTLFRNKRTINVAELDAMKG
ncbi:MAG: NADH-quinone oxidoreductase subunit NuoK [Xanthomonadaceae bacterium]|nr:NADH-quinone oxidoreductase subunit NuoK [Xanthomonadaceae bacterium]